MSWNQSTRRDFLQGSAAAAAMVSLGAVGRARQQASPPSAASAPLERRKFGKTDMTVTILGFGGAEIGYEGTEQATVDKLLNSALDAGLNVVDTAECYVDSEEQIGRAIGHRRKDFHLFTKCGHFEEEGASGWSRPAIVASIERSLKRLGTDAVDLVQLHSCSLDELKKGEAIEALEQAKKAGKTRYIGYSGDADAARYAVESGRFDALQTSVSLCDQQALELTLPLAKEKGLGVIAKRPIANAVWRYESPPEGYHRVYWDRLEKLGYDFAKGEARAKEGPDGVAGIALRFTAMQPVHVLIVGTTKPERWKQNADLLRAGPLSKELHDAIRARWKDVATSDWVGQT